MAWTERYVTDSGGTGAGTSGDPWSLTHAAANAAAGDRINVKAGTYSNGATDINFTTAGTDSAPIWWRGYKTTIGDMDGQPVTQRVEPTDIPLFTSTTGRYYIQAAADYHYWSNISFTSGYTASGTVLAYGASNSFRRCRFENTSTSSTGRAIFANDKTTLCECWLNVTNTQPDCIKAADNGVILRRCLLAGGNNGFDMNGQVCAAFGCIFKNQNVSAVDVGTGFPWLVGNSFYNSGGSLITLATTATTAYGIICGNVLDTSLAYAINQTGTQNAIFTISGNVYRDASFSSGRLNGITEDFEWDAITETAIPFVDAPGGDFTIKDTANCYGVVALFEKDGPTTYVDIGAVQHEDAGGGVSIPNRRTNTLNLR